MVCLEDQRAFYKFLSYTLLGMVAAVKSAPKKVVEALYEYFLEDTVCTNFRNGVDPVLRLHLMHSM